MAYDIVALLDDLFDRTGDEHGIGSPAVPVGLTIGPEALPMDWRIEWEERAANMEYDGCLTRERAESEAMKDIVRQMRDSGFEIDGT